MATTTTNFGWDIPQSTDLVKDGATAIAALGQDIDTALVDLKGGTTGQVLAKASGTDLDFSWVAQDDSNAIQNAIVDAKGDLISATAADTPARLAVGTNGQVLMADSAMSTGLKWATPAAGALTKISSASFTAQSSVVVDNCFTTSYKNYVLMWRMFSSGSGATLGFQYRTSAPATYATEYYGAFFSYGRNNSLATAGFINGSSATISNYLSGTDFFSSGTLNITGVGNATERPNTFGQNLQEFNGTAAVHASYNNTTGNYKGFVLQPSSGTITGFYALYGMEA